VMHNLIGGRLGQELLPGADAPAVHLNKHQGRIELRYLGFS
jgi:hypothetical protein